MARAPIPREILKQRLRDFVLRMREAETWELSGKHGGNLFRQFQSFLGPEFGERGILELEVNSGKFMLEPEVRIVNALLWDYIQGGILRLTNGPGSDEPWSGIYLTAEGRATLEGGTPIPEDVEAYLSDLGSEAPGLDQTALFYVKEALLASKARLYPSAMVMLGCAAEHLVLKMARSLVTRFHTSPPSKLERALSRDRISEIWKEFRKEFERHRPAIYSGETSTAETALDGLFLAVKTARDDSGHPQTIQVNERRARALLQAFPEYARAASRAIAGIPRL
jgi:hypothetical protein